MSITPSADSTLRGCAGGHHVGNSTGDRRLVAESSLVTVLAGLRPALTSLSLPAASQESMAARQHRGFVVENAIGPDVGPGALDH